MTTVCLKPIRGNVMRLTKLDACGTPVHGSKAFVVTDGFVSVELKAQIESGTEYKLKGANDQFIVNDVGRPLLKWYEVTINMGEVDPEAFNIATGSPIVLDDSATPQSVGYRVREGVYQDFALELWTDLSGQPCSGGNVAYGYLLLPWVTNAIVGDFTVENGLLTMPIQGARTHNNSLWGTGPFSVNKGMVDGLSKPLLTPIAATDHLDMHMTYLAPPVAQCGAQTLA
jgi:hypothetical protein